MQVLHGATPQFIAVAVIGPLCPQIVVSVSVARGEMLNKFLGDAPMPIQHDAAKVSSLIWL